MSVAFGTSRPSSTTVVATSTSSSPATNGAQHPLLLVGRERAVQQAHARGREAPPKLAEVPDGRDGAGAPGALAHVADDEGLVAARELLAQALVGGRASRRRRGRRRVAGARRPAGRSSRIEASRSPWRASASVRGMGVADSTSRCGSGAPAGAAPARAPPADATPKRCCSSTTTRRRSRNASAGSTHGVRPDDERDAARGDVGEHGRARARRRARREQRHREAEARRERRRACARAARRGPRWAP